MSIPHKHHWLPQFILRYFVDPSTPGLLKVYDIEKQKYREMSPSSICFRRDLYTFDVPGTTDEHRYGLETIWNKLIEDDAAPIIQELHHGGGMKSVYKEPLARFIANQLVRHPVTLESVMSHANNLKWQTLRRLTFDDAALTRFQEETGSNIAEAEIKGLRECFISGRVDVTHPWGYVLQQMAKAHSVITDSLLHGKWRIARTTKEAAFITCDRPVTAITDEKKDDRIVFIPLTPHLMIEIFVSDLTPTGTFGEGVLKRSGVRKRNIMTASNATLYIMSHAEILLHSTIKRAGIDRAATLSVK